MIEFLLSWPVILFFGVLLVWDAIFVQLEKPGISALGLIAFFTLLYFFGNFNILEWSWNNAGTLIFGTVAYCLIGMAWSVFRWYLFNLDTRRDYLKLDSLTRTTTDKERLKERNKPTVKDNKWKLITWIAYWPFSAFLWVASDPITRIFSGLYRMLSSVYQNIVDKVWEKV